MAAEPAPMEESMMRAAAQGDARAVLEGLNDGQSPHAANPIGQTAHRGHLEPHGGGARAARLVETRHRQPHPVRWQCANLGPSEAAAQRLFHTRARQALEKQGTRTSLDLI